MVNAHNLVLFSYLYLYVYLYICLYRYIYKEIVGVSHYSAFIEALTKAPLKIVSRDKNTLTCQIEIPKILANVIAAVPVLALVHNKRRATES